MMEKNVRSITILNHICIIRFFTYVCIMHRIIFLYNIYKSAYTAKCSNIPHSILYRFSWYHNNIIYVPLSLLVLPVLQRPDRYHLYRGINNNILATTIVVSFKIKYFLYIPSNDDSVTATDSFIFIAKNYRFTNTIL